MVGVVLKVPLKDRPLVLRFLKALKGDLGQKGTHPWRFHGGRQMLNECKYSYRKPFEPKCLHTWGFPRIDGQYTAATVVVVTRTPNRDP